MSAAAHALVVAALGSMCWPRPEAGPAPLQVVWMAAPPGEPPTTEAPAAIPAEPLPRETQPTPPDTPPADDGGLEPPAGRPAALEEPEAAPEASADPARNPEQADRASDTGPAVVTPRAGITWQILEDTRERVLVELQREQLAERRYRYLGRWHADMGDGPLLTPAPTRFEAETRQRTGLALTEPDGSQTRWLNEDCYSTTARTDPAAPYVLRNPPASIVCTGRGNPRSNLFESIKPPYLR